VDEIARWVGVDDGNAGYTWRYVQAKGAWAVVVEIVEGSHA
jgi:hypothetical protein